MKPVHLWAGCGHGFRMRSHAHRVPLPLRRIRISRPNSSSISWPTWTVATQLLCEVRDCQRGRNLAAIKRSIAELRKLQTTVRAAHPKDERPVASRRIPADLATAEFKSMSFFRDEVEALELAVAAVKADLALEHLHKPDDEVWRFAIAASLDKTTDQVSHFIETESPRGVRRLIGLRVRRVAGSRCDDSRRPRIRLG
jgi:hypothetical protein